MHDDVIVYVVDDDTMMRESIVALVQSMGLTTRQFETAEDFLAQLDPAAHGCVVADVRLPGISGVDLIDVLNERNCVLPVVVLTAFARTSLAVRAMQAGAVTVIDKPYEDNELWEAIRQSLVTGEQRRLSQLEQIEYQRRIDQLNESERAVLELVLAGKPNKSIARILDVSTRTIENRRRSVYSKLKVETLAELVRTVMKAAPDFVRPVNGHDSAAN